MLEAIGGSLSVELRQRCCDICTPTALAGSTLDLLHTGVTNRKRKRAAVREFSCEALESLKAKLLEARNVVMSENPAFLMIGPSFICPDSVITKLCNEAKCINDIDDLKGYGIRKELKECFLNIIVELSTVLPPPVRRFRS